MRRRGKLWLRFRLFKVLDILDKFETKIELFYWKASIKKICKKYNIHSSNCNKYVKTQKELFETINDKQKRSEEMVTLIYKTLILGRLYELNKEFLGLFKKEYFNSANAITRQIVEMYLKIVYCRLNPSYRKDLLKTLKFKFPTTFVVKEQLKKSQISFDYLNELKDYKEEFLEDSYKDFDYLSNMIHPSPLSYASNVWVVDDLRKEGTIKPKLLVRSEIEDGKKIIIFPKKSFVHSEHLTYLVEKFYLYTALILKEMKLVL